MLEDFAKEALKFGLKLNIAKTKVLTTETTPLLLQKPLRINGFPVQITPPTQSATYLGKYLCMENCHGAEVDHRIRCGWAAFTKYKHEFLGRYVSACSKIKLFEAVVTPSVMYATSS